jgi:hypothetical protein
VIDLKEKRRQEGCSERIVSKYRLLIWERDQKVFRKNFFLDRKVSELWFQRQKKIFSVGKNYTSSWYSLINEDFDNTLWEADQKVSTRKLFWERKISRF